MGGRDPGGRGRAARVHGELGRGAARLEARGLGAPKLTAADGHLGIWSALAQVWRESSEQRCWNHKLRNVLDAAPEKAQHKVKAHLQRVAGAESRATAERERRAFRLAYQTRYLKAVEGLDRD
jgi:putative transposase